MQEQEIRAALNAVSQETLADALALFFAEGRTPREAAAGAEKPAWTDFAQAVVYLKKNYDFPELDFFTVEAGLAYVRIGGRRVLLTDRLNMPPGMPEHNTAYQGREAAFDPPGREPDASEPDGGRFSNLEI